MRARLVLVRHGQAAFDQDEYDRLSPLGERQAIAFGRWWRQHDASPLTRCWSGPLQRQRLTAALAGQGAAAAGAPGEVWPPVEEAPGLREFDHREIFYRYRPELRDPTALAAWKAAAPPYPSTFEATWQAALQRWMGGQHDADYGESWPAFRTRCLATIAGLLADLGGEGVGLAFTSSGPIAVLLLACRGLPDKRFPEVQSALANGGFTEVFSGRDADRPAPGRLGRVDLTPHLLQAGERSLR